MDDSTAPSPKKIEIDELRTIEALERQTSGGRYLDFSPHFTLFRRGYALCVQLIHQLGDVAPKDDCDRALRDLACDTLDSLWVAEYALLCGYEHHALVLLRRSYETTSLMAYFVNFPDQADEWNKGKAIKPSEVREALDTAPLPEPKEALSVMYKVYSLFTHVNRETVLHRLLGEGNRLTLGCQGNVNPKTVGMVVRELLIQIMWFVDLFGYVYREEGAKLGAEYGKHVVAYRGQVQELAKELPQLY